MFSDEHHKHMQGLHFYNQNSLKLTVKTIIKKKQSKIVNILVSNKAKTQLILKEEYIVYMFPL